MLVVVLGCVSSCFVARFHVATGDLTMNPQKALSIGGAGSGIYAPFYK